MPLFSRYVSKNFPVRSLRGGGGTLPACYATALTALPSCGSHSGYLLWDLHCQSEESGCVHLLLWMKETKNCNELFHFVSGANVRHKSMQGLTAFDCIIDFDEWLECGFFTDEIKARLKGKETYVPMWDKRACKVWQHLIASLTLMNG